MTSATGTPRNRRHARARVADVMHHGVLSCASDTPLHDVARIMAVQRVHCVVVTEPSAHGAAPAWRVLTDLDVVAATVDESDGERTAGEIARQPAVTVGADTPLPEAARRMVATGVSHLLVLSSSSGRPAGVLSTLDIAGVAAGGAWRSS
jgi:CBS domain-containing protein